MINAINTSQFITLLDRLCQDLVTAKDYLNELDSAAGDGDMGISMSRGFEAVRQGLAEPAADIGALLVRSGMQFNEAAGSTIGALFSTAFMRAGKAAVGCTSIGLWELAQMGQAAEKGIRDRGKAELGKKTLLDALVPAVASLVQSDASHLSLTDALEQALVSAEKGMLATKEMVPSFGRARWMPERSKGHLDPGAVAIHMILKSIAASTRGLER